MLFETGYGPSGLPHIGTFGEVARTSWVRHAFETISDIPTHLIAFSDVDAGNNPVQATITMTNGTLTLNGTTGLTFAVGSGTGEPEGVVTALSPQPTYTVTGGSINGFTADDVSGVNLVLDEIVVNVMRHGYGEESGADDPRKHEIVVTLSLCMQVRQEKQVLITSRMV